MREFPKMLYRSTSTFGNQKALEAGLAAGGVKTLIVGSAAEQEAAEAEGWTEDLASFIGSPKKAKAAA